MKHDSGTNRYSREVCPSSAAVSAPGFLLARAHPCRDMQLPMQGGWGDAASQSSTACGKTVGRGSGGLEPVARMSGAPLNRARSCLSQARRDIRGTPACRHGGVPVARPRWLMRATQSVPSVDLHVNAIGRADPNRSTFANHVLRSRCAGREYDGPSPRSTRFSVGTGSSWDAEYNLCVVQIVTSVQLVTSGPCNGTHV
jgi:hypothetical protein